MSGKDTGVTGVLVNLYRKSGSEGRNAGEGGADVMRVMLVDG